MKYSTTTGKRLPLACAVASLMALSIPANVHAEWAYTAQAFGHSEQTVINFYQCPPPLVGWPCVAGGSVINWTLAQLTRAQGTMYTDASPTRQIAVQTQCVNTNLSPWQYKTKTAATGIQDWVSFQCPVGKDATWSWGALADPM